MGMKRSTTLGLDPKKVALLLGIGSDADVDSAGVGSAQVVAQLLDAYLATPAGTDTSTESDLALPAREGPRQGPASLREVLTDSQAPLETLRLIRQQAKKEASVGCSGAKQVTATTVYFAAIAGALVFHGRKLTTHSSESLAESFDDLAKKQWMPRDLSDLFLRACGICQERP